MRWTEERSQAGGRFSPQLFWGHKGRDEGGVRTRECHGQLRRHKLRRGKAAGSSLPRRRTPVQRGREVVLEWTRKSSYERYWSASLRSAGMLPSYLLKPLPLWFFYPCQVSFPILSGLRCLRLFSMFPKKLVDSKLRAVLTAFCPLVSIAGLGFFHACPAPTHWSAVLDRSLAHVLSPHYLIHLSEPLPLWFRRSGRSSCWMKRNLAKLLRENQ